MEKSLFFVGNYNMSTDSKGIYSVLLDESSGKMEIVSTCEQCENPSYLATTKNILYVANEVGDKAYMTAYVIGKDGSLTWKDRIDVPGAGMCYIAVWDNGQYISGANYTNGNIFTCSLKEDGSFKEVVTNYQNEGKSINEARQTGPHMHSITPDKKSKYWVAADLGTDDIFYYTVKDNGAFALLENIKIEGGEGPRHFVFDDKREYGYLVTELKSNIYVYKCEDDKLHLIQKLPAIVSSCKEENYAAHIEIARNQKYVYVSNRGADTMDTFKIEEDGKLSPYSSVPSYGQYPRHFEISPSGNYIIIAHQKSHEVVCCKIDAKGQIGKLVAKITIPKAINICFHK